MYIHTCMYIYIYVSRSTCDHRSFSGAPQTGPPGTYYNSQLGAWIRKSGVAGIRMHEASLSQGWASRGALLLPKLQSIRLTVYLCARACTCMVMAIVCVRCVYAHIHASGTLDITAHILHARTAHTHLHAHCMVPMCAAFTLESPSTVVQLFSFCFIFRFFLITYSYLNAVQRCTLQSSPTTIDLGPIFRGRSPSLQPARAEPVFESTSAPFHRFSFHVQPMDLECHFSDLETQSIL